ncbi:LysR family transcriptional regulator [Salipiger mangrovisoli]|uniref:LysR family transcriptional regulator n=1 Tax=Salipiger mangrovisoli TaxID=2865933 RepID=A0ABR9X178_9RHOB|nr:LysR family transcriptional regulator [Salipiger mangrovisoli]MBE9637261.1 LysR family transcriptional regulator [Salipiger mangrovisoli]
MLYNTLRQYEYLIAVAELGSLTDAARRLNVSQPSLSVAITQIEERLGTRLFLRRKGAPVEITPQGHRILARVRDLLDLARGIEAFSDQPAPFVVGCFEDLAPLKLAQALETLRLAFPSCTFEGTEGRFSDLAAGLEEGRIDLVISYDVGFAGRFERRVLKTVLPVAFLAPDHPLAQQAMVTLEDLAAHPLIFFSEELSEGFMTALFKGLRLSPTVGHKVRSLEMMRSLAAHGAGVGISYSCPPSDICYDGRPLVTVPISTQGAATEIALIWSRLREVDAQFERFIAALGEALA